MRNPEVVEGARKLIRAGADRELVPLFMRDRGFGQADCVYAIESLYKTKFSEAKNIVFISRAWSDQYESNKNLREAGRKAMRLLAEFKPSGLSHYFEDEGE
jgi:hypothetical protein